MHLVRNANLYHKIIYMQLYEDQFLICIIKIHCIYQRVVDLGSIYI